MSRWALRRWADKCAIAGVALLFLALVMLALGVEELSTGTLGVMGAGGLIMAVLLDIHAATKS